MQNYSKLAVLGIGNVLQKDDGIGVYASEYLLRNYTFNPKIKIINGGVEGIKLLDIFNDFEQIIILDTISLKDLPGCIYNIPTHKLSGYGLNSGSAHEIGVLQCLDILDLQGKPKPKANIIAITPEDITFELALSTTLEKKFEEYIKVVLDDLSKRGINFVKKENISLTMIIEKFKNPSVV